LVFSKTPEIGNLSRLIHLNLSENDLANVPTEIALLTQLEYLNLSHNNLEAIPKQIEQREKDEE